MVCLAADVLLCFYVLPAFLRSWAPAVTRGSTNQVIQPAMCRPRPRSISLRPRLSITHVSNCQTHQTLRGPPTLATSGMSGVHAPFVHPSATPPPFLTAPTLPPFTLLPAFPQVHRRPMLARCAHLRHKKAPAVCVLHELDPQPQLQPHLPGGGKEVKDVVCCMQTGYIMHADWAY